MPKDDFEYIGKIGRGSFSIVEKVKRKADGHFYAMKKVYCSIGILCVTL